MARTGRAFPPRGGIRAKRGAPAMRLYFPSTGTAAVSPTFAAGWEDTTSASPARRVIDPVVISSAMASVAFTDASTADRDILMYQGVTRPLDGAQTIGVQDVRIQFRALESLATNNMFLSWTVYVVSNDGLTVRGTVVAIQRDGTELDTVLTNRGDSATSTSVAALDTDRIVIEVGVGGVPVVSHDSTLRVGDSGGNDLPYDDVTTSDFNPFVQFDQVLKFGNEATGYIQTTILMMTGVGH